MKNNMMINGELLRDLLCGARIEEYHSAGQDWFVLVKAGTAFVQYETDDFLEFKVVDRHVFGRPTSLRKFRESIAARCPGVRALNPQDYWYQGMTKGEYEANKRAHENSTGASES